MRHACGSGNWDRNPPREVPGQDSRHSDVEGFQPSDDPRFVVVRRRGRRLLLCQAFGLMFDGEEKGFSARQGFRFSPPPLVLPFDWLRASRGMGHPLKLGIGILEEECRERILGTAGRR